MAEEEGKLFTLRSSPLHRFIDVDIGTIRLVCGSCASEAKRKEKKSSIDGL